MVSSAKLKRNILKQRGVVLEKHTRKPVLIADSPAPYRKTFAMKMVEAKFGVRLDSLLFEGTIYEAGKKLGVDATTISRWRIIVTKARDKEFWAEFPKEGVPVETA